MLTAALARMSPEVYCVCGRAARRTWLSGNTPRNDDVARVREASDIVRLIGEFISLRPKGREFVCLCPFHDDHSPSMSIVPSKQIFYCFVCQAGGDAITFIQKYRRMEFREALEYLAGRAGVTLTPWKPERAGPSDAAVTRSQLVAANEFAARFFTSLLAHPEHGSAGREIVRKRGIAPEIVEQFGIGASAARWDGLILKARASGVPIEHLREAGLLKTRDNGEPYDTFRNRLMFPIKDRGGQVVAFGARRIDDTEEPKYLNSPESRVFAKSSVLYALPEASRSILSTGTAIIAEGYMDAIACHQAGITNVVATLGTALTKGHAAELRRLCGKIVLLFDSDEGGRRAASRAFDILFSETLDVRIALLAPHTDAKDPDELLKRPGGADTLRSAIEQSSSLVEYHFAQIRAQAKGRGAGEVARVIEEEIRHLAEIGLKTLPPLRYRLIRRELALAARLDEATVERAVTSIRKPRTAESAVEAKGNAPLTSAEWVIGCLLCCAEAWDVLWHEDPYVLDRIAAGNDERAALARLMGRRPDGSPLTLAGVLDLTENEDERRYAVRLCASVGGVTEDRAERAVMTLRDALARLRAESDSSKPEDTSAGALARLERLRALHKAQELTDRRALPRPTI